MIFLITVATAELAVLDSPATDFYIPYWPNGFLAKLFCPTNSSIQGT